MSTTVRESEFEQFDREHFEALADLKADTCPGCGGSITATTADDGHGYEIDHVACQRCAMLARAQHDFDRATKQKPEVDGWHIDANGAPIVPSAHLWSARYLPPPH